MADVPNSEHNEIAQLLDDLGAVSLDPTFAPAPTPVVVDECAPNNVTLQINNSRDAIRALSIRFGLCDTLAMLNNDPALAHLRPAEDGSSPDWLAVNAVIEKRWAHEYRSPCLEQIPFSARWANRVHADPDIALWQVIGISPQGWMAALAYSAKSKKCRRFLFFRRATDEKDVPWCGVAGFQPLVPEDELIATHVDGSIVSMLVGTENDVIVCDVAHPRKDATRLKLGTDKAPPAIDLAVNHRRVLLLHKAGVVTIWHPNVGTQYGIRIFMPVPTAAPSSAARVNPITNEPLDSEAPDVNTEPIFHPVVRVAHDQFNPDAVVFSTQSGYIVHCEVDPPETPEDQALESFGKNVRMYRMGQDPCIGDIRIMHDSPEPAASMCVRSLPGNEPTLAQCGWHIVYRCDEVERVIQETGMAPRFPFYQAPDVGPMHCIATLGTTIVVHSRTNLLMIGSLVPDPQNPERDAARFRSGPQSARTSLAAQPTTFYPSLYITIDHIYWLLPDGMLMVTTPCTPEQNAHIREAQAKAKS